MVRRRRNERDSGNGVTRLGNHLVHLEARQLSAFTRLGTLRHLNLYLLGVDQIFCSYAEASRSHLLGLARKRNAVHSLVETLAQLAAFTCVCACAELVHGKSHCLVSLL